MLFKNNTRVARVLDMFPRRPKNKCKSNNIQYTYIYKVFLSLATETEMTWM